MATRDRCGNKVSDTPTLRFPVALDVVSNLQMANEATPANSPRTQVVVSASQPSPTEEPRFELKNPFVLLFLETMGLRQPNKKTDDFPACIGNS